MTGSTFGGTLMVEGKMADKSDIKVDFARKQVKFLKDNNIVDKDKISSIFSVAGPGQIKSAFYLANSCKSDTDKKILECLLAGYAYVEWGMADMNEIFKLLGFYVPKVESEDRFNRIIDGALEILIPQSVVMEE